MQARHVMTSPVITISPTFLVRDVAQLVLDRRISGVPVLNGCRLAGIVSESDLLRRRELGTHTPHRPRAWWRDLFRSDRGPALYTKAHGRRARDVMTRNVVWVPDDAPLSHVAELLEGHRIRRVPVVRAGRLVGIVTRADLVRAMRARSHSTVSHHRHRSDDEIRSALMAELESQCWWHSALAVVYVHDGVVNFRGFVNGEAERHAARVAAENIAGVRGVHDRRMLAADWNPMI